MTIRRLDVFFRTQLTLDTPSPLNSLTNLAFAPLQHLVGQNQYQSLKGKVSQVPPTTSPPSFYAPLRKVIRVFAFFLALVLTPIGIATRYLSLLSPEIDRAYSAAFLLTLKEAEYDQLMPHLPAHLIELHQALKLEKEKKQSLDQSLTAAIQSLQRLEAGLKSKGLHDTWVTGFRSDPLYPFPFYLAQHLENKPDITAQADTALWERFMALRQSCLNYLPSDCDDELLKTTQAQAHATLKITFQANVRFFTELSGKLESKVGTTEIKDWIKEKRREHNYSYPFYTQQRILKLMKQTVLANKLRPFIEVFSTSLSFLEESGLQEYIFEKPDSQHAAVNALMQAMDQLENISKLQELIKTQTA